jgi:addiction module HigA family antidote
MAADTIMGPVHPGEILLEEFLKPLSVSQYHLAKEIGVPARRVNEIVHGQRRISADTALRLARFFGTSAPTLHPGQRPVAARRLPWPGSAAKRKCQPIFVSRKFAGHESSSMLLA